MRSGRAAEEHAPEENIDAQNLGHRELLQQDACLSVSLDSEESEQGMGMGCVYPVGIPQPHTQ